MAALMCIILIYALADVVLEPVQNLVQVLHEHEGGRLRPKLDVLIALLAAALQPEGGGDVVVVRASKLDLKKITIDSKN